jgi:hypothetical protein
MVRLLPFTFLLVELSSAPIFGFHLLLFIISFFYYVVLGIHGLHFSTFELCHSA